MMNYIQITFSNVAAEEQEILIALLGEIGYSGFEEKPDGLEAFIGDNEFDLVKLEDIAAQQKRSFSKKIVEQQNWNALWEAGFEPVVVDGFVAVRAHFHQPVSEVLHELIITPKMSFGTGHHATTYMMMQQMRDIDFNNKTVLDFGTGTGVLAILAEKLGAKEIIAIDNDEWSIENARENCTRNNCTAIHLELIDQLPADQSFDILLANINKNVILANLAVMTRLLPAGGVLLLSGLLPEDEGDILNAASQHPLILQHRTTRGNWLCLKLVR